MESYLRLWALFLLAAAVSAQNNSVSVACGSSHVLITVPVDLFGVGVAVGVHELILGSGCSVTAVHQDVLQLQYPLHACGAMRELLPGSIHYRNVLHYIPSAASGVIRTSPFSKPIDCFYPRSWNVSSLEIQPTWIPFRSTLMENQRLEFALEVYDSTWSVPVSDPTYYLGDLINIQASVRKGSHVPLKIYIDECVARPNAESTVKYEVITNHGCLVDGQQSKSHFLPMQEDGIRRLQLDTFTFIGPSNHQIYLICHLKAVPVGSADPRNKACSYDLTTASWSSYEGEDCSCCASPSGCVSKKRRKRQQQKKGLSGEANIKLGPIALKEKPTSSFSALNGSSTSELSVLTSFATHKAPQAAESPAKERVTIIVREKVKEGSGFYLHFPFSISTLVIITTCAFIVFMSILGCYCSSRRSHRGYRMKTIHAALVEVSAVAMVPAATGTAAVASSAESRTISKRPDRRVASN